MIEEDFECLYLPVGARKKNRPLMGRICQASAVINTDQKTGTDGSKTLTTQFSRKKAEMVTPPGIEPGSQV
jgi:hypothetical protein